MKRIIILSYSIIFFILLSFSLIINVNAEEENINNSNSNNNENTNVETNTNTNTNQSNTTNTANETTNQTNNNNQKPSSTPNEANANLSSLKVSSGALSPAFSSDVTNYSVRVDDNISSLTISATKSDPQANISGTGTKAIRVGVNSFNVVVTAVNGQTKTYHISVSRGQTTIKNSPYLSSLIVKNFEISPVFDKYNNSYSLDVSDDIDAIDIDYTLEDTNATVKITGNEELIPGDNVVEITVTNNGEEQVYTIYVTKEETTKPTTVITDFDKDLNIDTNKRDLILISIISFIGLSIIGVSWFLLFKKGNKKHKKIKT